MSGHTRLGWVPAPPTEMSVRSSASQTTTHRRRRTGDRISAPSTRRDKRDALWLVAIAALGGGLSGVAPSGLPAADVVLAAGFAAGITLAASRARRWTWIWAATIALAAVGSDVAWLAVAALAFVVAGAAVVLERRARTWGALVGALCSVSVLHLANLNGVHGSSAAVAALAVLPPVVSGYRRSRVEERRGTLAVLGVVAVAALLALGAYGAAAFMARSDLDQAVRGAEQALEMIRDGDTEGASEELSAATASFERAESLLAGPLSYPALAVPVVGHHARATAAMARAGSDLARVAVSATEEARYDDVAPSAGQVDVARLVALRAPLVMSEDALLEADHRLADLADAWLLPPIAEPLDRLRAEVDDALDETILATNALAVAPALLGAPEAKTYVVLLGQPAESRFGGGFVGTWAELQASGGSVELTRSGTIEELRTSEGFRERTIRGPEEYLERYGRYAPAVNLQNVTASPDFPTVRRVISQLYPQTGGSRVDGALYLDPVGVGALLSLSGPVAVEGLAEPLTNENAAALLSTEIYELYPDADERDEVLLGAVDALFDALTSRDLPGPRTVASALGPAARGGHLSFSVKDSDGEQFLTSIGATGAFPRSSTSDVLAVKTANQAPNKIDTYLDRSVHYEAQVDPVTGVVEAQMRLEVTNRAPASGLPATVGGNRALSEGRAGAPPRNTALLAVSVWSPLQATEAEVDGVAAPVEMQSELGLRVYTSTLEVRPGQTVRFILRLSGAVGLPYELIVDHQPLANDDTVSLSLHVPDPALEGSGGVERIDPAAGTDGVEWRYQGTQTEDLVVGLGPAGAFEEASG